MDSVPRMTDVGPPYGRIVDTLRAGAGFTYRLAAGAAYSAWRSALQADASVAPAHVPRTEFDPLSDRIVADPYPAYTALQASGRVCVNERRNLWFLSHHGDVRAAARDHDQLSSADGILARPMSLPTMLSRDRPDHTRLRGVASAAFTKRSLTGIHSEVERWASAGVHDLARGHTVDVVSSLAIPLPVGVIAYLLGVPNDRFEEFRRWSDDVVALFGATTWSEMWLVSLARARSTLAMSMFLDQQLRRTESTDSLMARLAAATESGELTADEAALFAVLLLVGGNETTTNLIGTLLHALASHPDQQALLREDPALIPAAIEEAARWNSPVQWACRTTTGPYVVGDVTIPARARVVLLYGAANRDPAKYPDPDRFDVARGTSGHLAFGSGIHFCLGAHLARLETRVAVERVLDAGPELSAEGPVRWTSTPSLRGPISLPLRVRSAAPAQGS